MRYLFINRYMRQSIIFLLGIQYVNSYLMNPLPFGSNTIGRIFNQFNNDDTDVSFKKYSSKGLNPVETKNAIFLPAITGNSATAGLYQSFLNIMTRKSFDIYVPDSDYQMILDDINTNTNTNGNTNADSDNTNNTNNDITLIAHSSAALTAITMVNTIENIKTLVLIDPIDVNNGDIDKEIKSRNPVDYDVSDINQASKSSNRDKNNKNNKNKKFQLENIDRLLIINTKRSHEWSIMPFIFPIGSFAIKPDRFIVNENVTQEVVKADDFGHFDILDDRWSNMIHNTLSKGCEERDPDQLELFRAWISNKIVEVTV